MEAIIKKENVYVYVNKDLREGISSEEIEGLIISDNEYKHDTLYGGRVHIWYSSGIPNYSSPGIFIDVDSISIYNFNYSGGKFICKYYLSFNQAVAYLNQMENLGIDSFLENYKNQLKELKKN